MRQLRNSELLFRTSAALIVAGLLSLGEFGQAGAQTPQGATLTVTAGQAGVLKANGAQVSPASSGLNLGFGDQIGTIGNSSALVTFFEGTEIELGKDTTIILREIRASGSEVHVTVENVFGATASALKGFVSPNSSYQVQNPGATTVAVGRGTRIYYASLNNNTQVVGLFDCNATQAAGQGSECYLLSQGGRFSGPAIYTVEDGAVSQSSNTDSPPDSPAITSPPRGGIDKDSLDSGGAADSGHGHHG